MQRLSGTCETLGALKPGSRPLEGKTFYLDEVKSRSVSVLSGIISRLGGKVESFLHKDVNVVITANRDALADAPVTSGKLKACEAHQPGDCVKGGAERPVTPRPSGTSRPPVCGSRGKALLEKAIRNNEKSQAGVLASARSWGVKIVVVDDFLKFVHRLNSEVSNQKSKRNEKKSDSSGLNIIKACSLKSSYVKVEDSSRKYRPVYAQSLTFPVLSYTRIKRFSPFESPAPVQTRKIQEEDLSKDKLRKSEELISSHDKPLAMPSPLIARKKKSLGYCECCQVNYKDQDEHLQSEVHQRFVQDVNNYAVVDQLVAEMTTVFTDRMEACDDPTLMRSFSSSLEAQPWNENGWELFPANFIQDSTLLTTVNSADVKVDDDFSETPLKLQEVGEPCIYVPVKTPDKANHVESNAPSIHPLHAMNEPDPEPDVSRVWSQSEVCVGSSRVPPLERTLEGKAAFTNSSPQKQQGASSCSTLTDCSRLALLSLNLSNGVNPKKRSRSFTVSPKVSKIRRTCAMSEPTIVTNDINVDSPASIHFGRRENESLGCADTNECAQSEPKPADQDLPKVNTIFDKINDQPTCQKDEQKAPKDRGSSELGPPELYPFYLDDHHSRLFYPDPPKLKPCAPLPSPKTTHTCTSQSQASSASLLSQSFSSVCIESTLIPDVAFSTASSESDWDSGLLSRLAPAVQLRPKTGPCELDLGLLLQSSCAGVQDGSYASRLCSVLQPGASAHVAFGDVMNSGSMYRPMETLDRRIVSTLGV